MELGAREKVVRKMTREGLTEKNLASGRTSRISSRIQDAVLVKGSEERHTETVKYGSRSRSGRQQRRYRRLAEQDIGAMENIELGEDVAQPLIPAYVTEKVGYGETCEEPLTEYPDGQGGPLEQPNGYGELGNLSDESQDMRHSTHAKLREHRSRMEEKSVRANERLEKAQSKAQRTKKKIKKERIYDEQKGRAKTRLYFDDELADPSKASLVSSVAGGGKAMAGNAARYVVSSVHGKVYQVEDENLGVKSAHRTEIAGENALRMARADFRGARHGSWDKVSRLEHKAEKANTKLLFEKSLEENPEIKKSRVSKLVQKRQIKQRYAAAYKTSRNSSAAVQATSTAASPAAQAVAKTKDAVVHFVRNNRAAIATLAVAGIFLVGAVSAFGTLGSMIGQAGGAVMESTYLASDEAILAADEDYSEMEDQLQSQLDNIESTYPGYDEYRYQVDEITHDSYALTSYLTALYGNYLEADVQGELASLFAGQYTLTVTEEVEIRTRTVTDPDTGEESEEEYEYYILNVKLTNKGLDAIARVNLNETQLSLYQIYQVSLGNRSYLFGDTVLGNPADGGMSYEIPSEALEDEAFARMIAVAERYLGMAYVWGGSSPSTGFDCSGFVSYVINNCGNGWNYGRQTANGLRSICTYVTPSEAQPGDLIFFQGTYNTSGASHVGIYVGNGMMIHCGNPIQYTSIESSYWQNHFLCYGRIN